MPRACFRNTLCIGFLISTVMLAAHAALPSLQPVETLTPEPSDLISSPGFPPSAQFGYSVAVRDNLALVGMPLAFSFDGRVAAFTREADGTWRRTATLRSSQTDGASFGQAIAFRSGIAAIASSYDVHIFKYQVTSRTWKRLRRIVTPSHDLRAVDYQDGMLVASGIGAVHVYRIDGAGNVLQQWHLMTNDGHPNDGFGWDAAWAANTIVVGAPDLIYGSGDVFGPGSAYVFRLQGGQWTQTQKLSAVDGTDGDGFGASVAIDNGMIIVGAPGYRPTGNPNFPPPEGEPVAAGMAFVYTADAGVWRERARLRPGAQQHSNYGGFGRHIAMFDKRVVITANANVTDPPLDLRYSGLAFVYTRSGSQLSAFGLVGPESGFRIHPLGQPASISNMVLLLGAPLLNCPSNCIGGANTFDLRLPLR